MADAYWRYNANNQQQAATALPPPLAAKRPRTEFDLTPGQDLSGYYPREENRNAPIIVRDTDSINASYDRYLRSTQMPPPVQQIPAYNVSEPARAVSGVINNRSVDEPYMMSMSMRGPDPLLPAKNRGMGILSGRPENPLPSDASNTLFVEGLPANCTRREVSHIFRPFVGYKEVRLVTKEPRRTGQDPLVLCFVDFVSPAHAATAMDALKGYVFDEHDRDSIILRLQFARNPGLRSGSGPGTGTGSGSRPKR